MRAPCKHGLASRESRDPIGYAVAALSRVAQSDLLDRVGLRKHAEQAVFSVTRSGFRTATAASRAFTRVGSSRKAGVRPPAAPSSGVFDLTATEDEQMLVDVAREYAEEVLRPAAAQAVSGAKDDNEKVIALITYLRKNTRSLFAASVTDAERAKIIKSMPKDRVRTSAEVFKSGIGTAESVLSDVRGRIGRAAQSLLIAQR